MRVLQITRRFVRHEWGGTETVVLETSKRLLARGLQTEVFCPNALAESDHELLDGVTIRRFGYFYPYLGLTSNRIRQMDKKAGNLFSFSLLRQLKRETPINLLHLHTGKRLGGIVRHVARQRNIPYVVSLHGGLLDVPADEAEQWTAPSRGTLEWGKILGWWVGSRRVLEDAAAILCVGAREFRAVREHFPRKRVICLPNGVDVERFRDGEGAEFRQRHGIPINAFVLLCVGRIDPQKNQIDLVRALPEWKRINPNVHLVLVGHVTNEDFESRIRKEIRQSNLQADVTIIPGIDPQSSDLPNAYHAADLFVLPSLHEPFGIVVVEAWAAGLPVVASRVGGLADLIVDGQDGHLFDVRNRDDLISTVSRVLQTPADGLAPIVSRARNKAETEYSWDRVTEQLLEIYAEVSSDLSYSK